MLKEHASFYQDKAATFIRIWNTSNSKEEALDRLQEVKWNTSSSPNKPWGRNCNMKHVYDEDGGRWSVKVNVSRCDMNNVYSYMRGLKNYGISFKSLPKYRIPIDNSHTVDYDYLRSLSHKLK
tara:strand:+ start:69 stop:437 length:369 start_codon:yes stop_codon:yes gene_type:complete